jgi:[acyl-carrier-protein] S-malonyltransferase
MRKLGLLFPGQGTQVVGMGHSFVESYAIARNLFDRASEILGYDLALLCREGPLEKLTESRYCQPALFVHQFVAAQILQELFGKQPFELAMGLSIGELTALAVAGVYDFEIGVKITQKRGEFIQEACEKTDGGMLAVFCSDSAKIQKLCELCDVEMSNRNTSEQIVLSGEKSKIQKALAMAAEITGGKSMVLNVAGAFHSSLMESARKKFGQYIENVAFRAPQMAVVGNVTGQVMRDPALLTALLIQQIVSPVRWLDCMHTACEWGVGHFYQCGSGTTLVGMGRRIDPKLRILPFGKASDPMVFEQ